MSICQNIYQSVLTINMETNTLKEILNVLQNYIKIIFSFISWKW